MSAVVVIIVLVVIFLLVGIGILFTWSWWKRWLNRCLSTSNGVSPPDARWEPNGSPTTFSSLDPSALERPRNRNGSVTIEPLPNLSALNIDPRQSFELRNTKYPQGIIPVGGESSIHAHDWFHPPYESFPRVNLEYFKVLGKGWFGKVIEAEAKNISPIMKTKKVIVKQMRDDANEMEQMRFLNQSRVYRDSNHGNILKLLGYCVDSLPYLGIYEHWPLGDLKSYLIAKKKCGEAGAMIQQGVISRMAVDIGKALEYLLALGFIHEDLSARNCMVGNVAGKIVMGDYGLAPNDYPRDYYKISNLVIPIRWAAPEAFDFHEGTCTLLPITGAANIWSYAVVLFELYEFGKTPYAEMSDEDVISRVLVLKSYLMEPPSFPFVEDSTKERLYKLMLSCWNTVPTNRPTIQQILEVLSTP